MYAAEKNLFKQSVYFQSTLNVNQSMNAKHIIRIIILYLIFKDFYVYYNHF